MSTSGVPPEFGFLTVIFFLPPDGFETNHVEKRPGTRFLRRSKQDVWFCRISACLKQCLPDVSRVNVVFATAGI
jgi:hypothetical protein